MIKWRTESAMSGSNRTLSEWALRKMTTTDFTMIQQVESLEMQVRGLSRLAGLTYEEATVNIQRAWSASTTGTRSYRSPADASAGQVASPGVGGPAASKTSAAAVGAVESLAPANPGGGSPADGFSTPRAGRRLGPFSTPSPTGLLGMPLESGPRGPWKGIAAATAVDSPSGWVPGAAAAEPSAPSGGHSPPREDLDREMLE